MAQLISTILIFAICIFYTQIKNWFSWRSLRKWGTQFGCADVPTVKNKLPGGLERYSVLFTGLKGMSNLLRKELNLSPMNLS